MMREFLIESYRDLTEERYDTIHILKNIRFFKNRFINVKEI